MRGPKLNVALFAILIIIAFAYLSNSTTSTSTACDNVCGSVCSTPVLPPGTGCSSTSCVGSGAPIPGWTCSPLPLGYYCCPIVTSTPISGPTNCHLCESLQISPSTIAGALTETSQAVSPPTLSPANSVNDYNTNNAVWFLTCPLNPNLEPNPTDNSLFYTYPYDDAYPNIAGDACLANQQTFTTNLDLPVGISWAVGPPGTFATASVGLLTVTNPGYLTTNNYAYSPELEAGGGGGNYISSSFSVNSYVFQRVPAIVQNDIWSWSATFANFPGTAASVVQTVNAIPEIEYSHPVSVPCGDAGVPACAAPAPTTCIGAGGVCVATIGCSFNCAAICNPDPGICSIAYSCGSISLHLSCCFCGSVPPPPPPPTTYPETYVCQYTYGYQETTTLQSINNQQIPFNEVLWSPSGLGLNPDSTTNMLSVRYNTFYTPILPYLTFNYIMPSVSVLNAPQLADSYDIFSPWNYNTPASSIDMFPIDTPSILYANYSNSGYNFLISLDSSVQNPSLLEGALVYISNLITGARSSFTNFWATYLTSTSPSATGVGSPANILNPISIATAPNDYIFVLNQPTSGGDYYLSVLRMIPRGYYNTTGNEPTRVPSVSVDTSAAASGETEFTNSWANYWENVVNSQNYTTYIVRTIDLGKSSDTSGSFIGAYLNGGSINGCTSSSANNNACTDPTDFKPLNISTDSNGDVFIAGELNTHDDAVAGPVGYWCGTPSPFGGTRCHYSAVIEIPHVNGAMPTPSEVVGTTGDWSTNPAGPGPGAAGPGHPMGEITANPDGTLVYVAGTDSGTIYVLSPSATQLGQENQFDLTFATLGGNGASSKGGGGTTLDIPYWLIHGGLYGVPFNGFNGAANVLDSSDCSAAHTDCNNADPTQDFDSVGYHHPLGIANVNGYLYVLDNWSGDFGQYNSCGLSLFGWCALSSGTGGVTFDVLMLRVLDSGGGNVPINPSQLPDLFSQQGCTESWTCTGAGCGTSPHPPDYSCEVSGVAKAWSATCLPTSSCVTGMSQCTPQGTPSAPAATDSGELFSCGSITSSTSVSAGGSSYYGLASGSLAGGYPPYGWIIAANVLPSYNDYSSSTQVLKNTGFETGSPSSLFPWLGNPAKLEQSTVHAGIWAYSMDTNLQKISQTALPSGAFTSLSASVWVYVTSGDTVELTATDGLLCASAALTGPTSGWQQLTTSLTPCGLPLPPAGATFTVTDLGGCSNPSTHLTQNCGTIYIDDAALTVTGPSLAAVNAVNFCSSSHYCPQYNPDTLSAGATGTHYNFLPIGPLLLADDQLSGGNNHGVGFSVSSNGTVAALFNKNSGKNPEYSELFNASFGVENYTKLFDGNLGYTCYTNDPNAVMPMPDGCDSLVDLANIEAPIAMVTNPFRYLESLGNTQVLTFAGSGLGALSEASGTSATSVYTTKGPPSVTITWLTGNWGDEDAIVVQQSGTVETLADVFNIIVTDSHHNDVGGTPVQNPGVVNYAFCTTLSNCLPPGTYTVQWNDVQTGDSGSPPKPIKIANTIAFNMQPTIIFGSGEIISATLPPGTVNDKIQITVTGSSGIVGQNTLYTTAPLDTAQLVCPSSYCPGPGTVASPQALSAGTYTVTVADLSETPPPSVSETLTVEPQPSSVPAQAASPQSLQSSVGGYAVVPYEYSYLLHQAYSTGGSESSGVIVSGAVYAADVGATCPGLSLPANPPDTSNTVFSYGLTNSYSDALTSTVEGGDTYLEYFVNQNYYMANLTNANLIVPPQLLYQIQNDKLFGEIWLNVTSCSPGPVPSPSEVSLDCSKNNQAVVNAIVQVSPYNIITYSQSGCAASHCGGYETFTTDLSPGAQYGPKLVTSVSGNWVKPLVQPTPAAVAALSPDHTVSLAITASPVVMSTPDVVFASTSTPGDEVEITIGAGGILAGPAPGTPVAPLTYTIDAPGCATTYTCLPPGTYTIGAIDTSTGQSASATIIILPQLLGFNSIPTSAITSVPLFDLYKQVLWDSPLDTYLNATLYSTASGKYALRGYQQLVYVMTDRFNNMVYVPLEADVANPVTITLNVNPQSSPINPNMTAITISGQVGYYSNGGAVFTPLPQYLYGPNGKQQQVIYIYYNKNINYVNYNTLWDNLPSPTEANTLAATYCAYGTSNPLFPVNCLQSNPVYITPSDDRTPNSGTINYNPSFNSLGGPDNCNPPGQGLLVPQYWQCNVYGPQQVETAFPGSTGVLSSLCPNTGALQSCDASYPEVAACLSSSDAQSSTQGPQIYCSQVSYMDTSGNPLPYDWNGFLNCVASYTAGNVQFCEQTDFSAEGTTPTAGDGICTSQLGLIPYCAPNAAGSCTPYPDQVGIPITDSNGDFNTMITACGSRTDQLLAQYYGWPPPEPISANQVPLSYTANAVDGNGCTGSCAAFVLQQQNELNYSYSPTQTSASVQIGVFELGYGELGPLAILACIATAILLLFWSGLRPSRRGQTQRGEGGQRIRINRKRDI